MPRKVTTKPPAAAAARATPTADTLNDPLGEDTLRSGVLDDIAGAFGRHRVDDAPVDASGADPRLAAMGTPGVTDDDGIAVAPEADRHVRAHEAAHWIQRRNGVPTDAEFPGGAEGHANAVADAVVAGEGAEGLLDLTARATGSAAGAQAYTVPQQGRKRSENATFEVRGDDLYAKPDADLPDAFVRAGGGGFKQVTLDTDVLAYSNDCLEFAENVALSVADRTATVGGAQFRAVGDGTNRLFGHTAPQNKSIAAGDWNVGTDAAPDVGEAFAISRSDDHYATNQNPGDTLNYHAATVIAEDGDDKITAEADASDPDRVAPVFDMYGTEEGQTFHDAHSPMYGETQDMAQEEVAHGTGVLRLDPNRSQ